MGDDGPTCPICSLAKTRHLFRSDLKICASSSSACPLCLDPTGSPYATRIVEGIQKRGRRKRRVVATDLSHAFAAFFANARPWDEIDRDSTEFRCVLCSFEWAENITRAYKRFSRRANICPSCSHLDSTSKWIRVRPSFCGAPPICPGIREARSWKGLIWPASSYVHPDSIYAVLPARSHEGAVDMETVDHRISRMCPELLARPAHSRPGWVCTTYASEAERFVAAILLRHLRAPLFREVDVDVGGWRARFDFGFVAGPEIRFVEVDGAQHFNPEAFQFRFVPGKRARHGAAWRRDRDKDAFVQRSGNMRLLRISASSLEACEKVVRRWCDPRPFASGPPPEAEAEAGAGAGAEGRVVYFGDEYLPEEMEVSSSSRSFMHESYSRRHHRPRSRDLETMEYEHTRIVCRIRDRSANRRISCAL